MSRGILLHPDLTKANKKHLSFAPPIDVRQFVQGHVIIVVASCVCSFLDLLVHHMTLMSHLDRNRAIFSGPME